MAVTRHPKGPAGTAETAETPPDATETAEKAGVDPKAKFPMRFGEEAEEFSFEVSDLPGLRSKAKELKAKGQQLPAARVREMYANMGLVGLGLSLGVLGVQMSLKSAGGGH